MKTKNILIIASIGFLLLTNCTNVDERVYDQYAADEFYATPEGTNAALASVYAQVAGNWDGVGYAGADRGWYDLNSMCADEQVIPHRNDGNWEIGYALLYKHEWLPTDTYIDNTWNWLYKSVFNANLAVSQLEKAHADPSKIAEARVLRAFFYYLLIDDFGNVPFYTENTVTVDQIPQKNRAEIFDYIVSELNDNVEKLSPTKGGEYYGRFNKWAGYALLAKVYLNAGVYTGTPKWQECLETCNKITAGGFSLHPGGINATSPLGYKYYELFGDVLPDDETILAMYVTANIVSRNIYSVRSLNGANSSAITEFGWSGWNGTIVPKLFYQKYDNSDIRKKQFLIGAQPGGVTYTLDISSLDDPGAAPQEGIRDIKFYPVGPMGDTGASNDFPIYRYADIMLMQAECYVRLGNAGSAKPLVDAVRQRAGLGILAGNPTLDNVYDERGCELNWEGHRRQDMIRFDKFLLPNAFRGTSPEYKKLFPIPTSALDANHGLQQNPGYN